MTPQQMQLMSKINIALLQLEMLQLMAKKSSEVLNAYSIFDYACVLDGTINELSSAFAELDETIAP